MSEVEKAQKEVPTTVMLALNTLNDAVEHLLKMTTGLEVPEEKLPEFVTAITDTAEAMSLAIFAEAKRYEQEKK